MQSIDVDNALEDNVHGSSDRKPTARRSIEIDVEYEDSDSSD